MANSVDNYILPKGPPEQVQKFLHWLFDGETFDGEREFRWNGELPRRFHWKLNDFAPNKNFIVRVKPKVTWGPSINDPAQPVIYMESGWIPLVLHLVGVCKKFDGLTFELRFLDISGTADVNEDVGFNVVNIDSEWFDWVKLTDRCLFEIADRAEMKAQQVDGNANAHENQKAP
jgi:hypothetical protein